jgi:hypothetical protein
LSSDRGSPVGFAVSRIVTRGTEEGTIIESIDPDDRRKRVLTIGPRGVARVEGFYTYLSEKFQKKIPRE